MTADVEPMKPQTLLIRADASATMGTGHVLRCLALAQAWQDAGGQAVFAMNQPLSSLRERLLNEGFQVVTIEAPPSSSADANCTAQLACRLHASWVVVDGYHFCPDYYRELKTAKLKVLMIDDRAASTDYVVDIVLNQNAYVHESLYTSSKAVPKLLLGLQYVLLRRDFAQWSGWSRPIPELGSRVLVTMGGTDPDNLTLHAVNALKHAGDPQLEVTVLVGRANPHIAALEQACSGVAGFCLQREVRDIPKLMAASDAALLAGGGTLWEALFMGCCVLSFARDKTQRAIVSQLGKDGLLRDLGDADSMDSVALASAILDLCHSRERRSRMSALARQQVDGKGATRVCQHLTG